MGDWPVDRTQLARPTIHAASAVATAREADRMVVHAHPPRRAHPSAPSPGHAEPGGSAAPDRRAGALVHHDPGAAAADRADHRADHPPLRLLLHHHHAAARARSGRPLGARPRARLRRAHARDAVPDWRERRLRLGRRRRPHHRRARCLRRAALLLGLGRSRHPVSHPDPAPGPRPPDRDAGGRQRPPGRLQRPRTWCCWRRWPRSSPS